MGRFRFSTNPAVFMMPLAGFMAAILLIPVIQVIGESFAGGENPFAGYQKAFTSTLLLRVLVTTIEISVVSGIVTLLLAYPIAYHLSRQSPKVRTLLMIFVLLPFWTSILVKSYAFTITLGHDGIINNLLGWGFGDEVSIKLLYNRAGVIIGLSHFLLPFMILPILGSLLMQPPELRRAAFMMGAGRFEAFWRVTFPLSLPGIVSGSIITLTLSLGMFITPALLGGRKDLMLANMVDFYVRETLNWNLAAVLSVILLVMSGVLIALLLRIRGSAGLVGGGEL